MLDMIQVAAGILMVTLAVLRWTFANQSGGDMTRYDERESNFDFNLTHIFLVIVAIGGAIWLISGGLSRPI